MKKYFFFRFIRSIISIVIVTTIAFVMVYSLVPRTDIFENDPVYSKLKGKPDDLAEYENVQFSKNGYIDYKNSVASCEIATDSEADYKDCISTTGENKYLIDWAANTKGEWVVGQFPISGRSYITREIPLLERVGNFYSSFLVFDSKNKVQDPTNPDLERYIRFENSPQTGPILACSGCENRSLVYFDGSFPFIHQNFVKLNLGTSFPTHAGRPVVDVIGSGQGKTKQVMTEFETGYKTNSALNLNRCVYKNSDTLDHLDTQRFDSNYANCASRYENPSMIGISLITGVIAVFIAYAVSIPLGSLMARKKGTLVDRVGVGFITVLISVPSLAFIYFFRFLGNKIFGLPDLFPSLGAGNPLSYVLPTLILGLLSISGLMIWVRRYMIDQTSADYVKFAKAKGLSDKEISRNHIFKNAVIPITNGIPGSIILAITGATITETIFAVPGMGKMLPEAIKGHNNPMVIGLVFIFTTLSILSVFLGDLLLTKVDPRINLDNKGGSN